MNREELDVYGNQAEKAARPYLKAALAYVQANPKLVAVCIACFIAGAILGHLA